MKRSPPGHASPSLPRFFPSIRQILRRMPALRSDIIMSMYVCTPPSCLTCANARLFLSKANYAVLFPFNLAEKARCKKKTQLPRSIKSLLTTTVLVFDAWRSRKGRTWNADSALRVRGGNLVDGLPPAQHQNDNATEKFYLMHFFKRWKFDEI